jgi:nucleotide-binding universal stress UspA family protein
MKTIVVGYDESALAERALQRAADIGEALGARLVVVSVTQSPYEPALVPAVETIPALAGPLTPVPPLEPESRPRLEPAEIAQHQLERARMALTARELETEYVVEFGDPAERLLEVAEQHDADLIAVGSREHGFLERLLGHSVDEEVAKHCGRDVLLVR